MLATFLLGSAVCPKEPNQAGWYLLGERRADEAAVARAARRWPSGRS